ncbi:hypothetical protein [Geomicrobium sp. JCM 19037]|nr:hypothetical protein [Geomicrobium sp. JCM 19037]
MSELGNRLPDHLYIFAPKYTQAVGAVRANRVGFGFDRAQADGLLAYGH